MNSDFPRIISLLRKERNISQKQAAADLGVSQALLSHYEKGIRECGLDFLVRAADYYNVSCDYLLGRSPEPSGKVISAAELPESGESARSREHKLVTGSADILFSLAKKTGSATVLKSVSDYLMLAAYKMFRIVYSANSRNDSRFFSIPDPAADHLTDAAMSVSAAAAKAAVSGVVLGDGDKVKESTETLITTNSLSEEFGSSASSLLSTVKESEACISELLSPTAKKK